MLDEYSWDGGGRNEESVKGDEKGGSEERCNAKEKKKIKCCLKKMFALLTQHTQAHASKSPRDGTSFSSINFAHFPPPTHM